MDTRQLRYFVAIYEHKNLSRAAQACNVAQSALSHHIGNLEKDFATPLFLRQPRGMLPTAAGERLYQHAKLILRAMETAENDIRHAHNRIAGDVSLGMAYSAVKAVGVQLMKRIDADYPDVRLSITESIAASALVQTLETEVDLALVYNPPGDPRLVSEPVLEEQVVCIGQRAIIGDTDAPIAFEEMLELPIIVLTRGVASRAQLDDPNLLKRVEARAKLQMNGVHVVAVALTAGLGCFVGTRLFTRELLEEGVLHARPVCDPELFRTLHLCRLADRPMTFAIEAMRRTMLEIIGDEIDSGGWEARRLFD